jgi:hypothetical protein
MTQSGGNGHKPEVEPDDITIFKPIILPDDDPETEEPLGYVETGLTEDEGEYRPELPPELQDDSEEQPN